MTRNAILLSTREDTDEISALLRTLDIDVNRIVIQKRSSPHRTTFLGPGRIDDVVEDVRDIEIDLVVVNGILRPAQHHALEMLFAIECVDRVGVILRIFAEHAHTDEAKRQVTLATLRYELPFLREWIHKAKSGERPGFLSGGAYATEVYYEHSRSHIRRIEEELEGRSQQRELRRKRRRDEGYFLVSLAGYTNAGKSAVLNALCDTKVEVDGRLFSTLSTTTRRLRRSSRNLLLTDTVGFIKDLPPELVNAFNSTLEEIFLADMILLVVDISESLEVIRDKITTSHTILTPRLQGQTVVIVGSKADLLPPEEIEQKRLALEQEAAPKKIILTSAITDTGLDELVRAIESASGGTRRIEALLPLTDEAFSLISSLHDLADVDQTTSFNETHLTVTCMEKDHAKILARIEAVGGMVRAIGSPMRRDAAP